ncbi:MAG: hypothetical protein M3Y24_12495 [Acidobacteriota bacterium]|nr:hypothetical protein [Acidobacteriota bacterium]
MRRCLVIASVDPSAFLARLEAISTVNGCYVRPNKTNALVEHRKMSVGKGWLVWLTLLREHRSVKLLDGGSAFGRHAYGIHELSILGKD